ncbi:hypothetical protein SLEP1_g26170 [Rubroshorea leprosula]|uniref:Uncharacterized protein n=1 Tax=Rubroshorea leprosula TaxID=152421 RepID=A0AAV5JUW5_9ROSI|nr:hypothetical protein SLEP1_g26170 [Rubroshorea leprosula]
MQRMLEDMGRMQAALLQQFTAFTSYGMCPLSANPSLTYAGQAFPVVGSSYPTTGPSFLHAMLMQLPIEPAFPMGQMGGQSEAPDTSLVNALLDDYGYLSRFDTDYQGPFGPE